MAHVKETAKLIDGGKATAMVEDLVQQSGDEDDLSQVDADLSDLMGREKLKATLQFGSSLVSQNLIDF
jgi:hypothetical protein